MAAVTDQAVCIRHWDWSETSQTVSMFTREHGVIRALAKGSKRENSRFSGGVEILTRAEAILHIKPSDALSILASWDLLETFPCAAKSLGAFYAAMFILDVVHHAVQEHDPHPALFDALLDALRSLGAPGAEPLVCARFLSATLAETGHRPDLHHDVRTHSALPDAPTYVFLPHRGGLCVDGPEHARTNDPDGPAWRVRAETVEFLRSLEENRRQDPEPANTVTRRAARLLAMYFRELIRTEPSSMPAFLDTLGIEDPKRRDEVPPLPGR